MMSLAASHAGGAAAVPAALQKLIEDLSSVAKMDAPLSLKTSTFSVTLSPLK